MSGANNSQTNSAEPQTWRVDRTVIGCIALILLIALFPLLRTGYTVPDDFGFSLWANNSVDRWPNAWGAAVHTGRFQVFFHICLAYIPHFFDSHAYLKFIQIGSMALAVWLFAQAVAQYCSDRQIFMVVLLLFGAFIPNMWEHHLYSAYPFVFQFGLGSLALSFLAFQKTLIEENNWRHRWLTGIFLFLALLTYEAFALYGSIFLLLAWTYQRGNGWRTMLVAMLPVLSAIGVFALLYMAWRWQYPTKYAGANVSAESLDLRQAIGVIWQFSVASFPGYVFTHFTEIHQTFPESPEGFKRSILGLLNNMRVEWLVKAILASLGIWLVQYIRAIQLTNRQLLVLFLVGALLILLPPLPLSLTPKYQKWVYTYKTEAYVVTYFSYFGIVLILAVLATAIVQLGRNRVIIRRISVGTLATMTMLLSLVTDYGNASMHRSQALDALKWKMVDRLLASQDFQAVSAGDCLLLDEGLTQGVVPFAVTSKEHWKQQILRRTGTWVSVFDSQAAFMQCMTLSKMAGFYIRYRQESNVANQFISLARVLGEESGHLIGDRAIVYSLGYSRKFQLTWLTPMSEQPAVAEIDGEIANGQSGYSVIPVNKSREPSGTLRTEIRAEKLVLDSLGINFFAEREEKERTH